MRVYDERYSIIMCMAGRYILVLITVRVAIEMGAGGGGGMGGHILVVGKNLITFSVVGCFR